MALFCFIKGVLTMIRHLNPIDFQKFGTILPERTNQAVVNTMRKINLTSGNNIIYRSDSPVQIRPGEQTALLSVSLDGQQFSDFYFG